jgi:hypothetical protein
VDELLKNKLGLQVLTDTGWSNFDGLVIKGNKQTVEVKTQHRSIICTLNHCFFNLKFDPVESKQLRPGSVIQINSGIDKVVSVTLRDIKPVYDLFDVKKNHRFYANDILVKNCEFIINDETLINPLHLVTMTGTDPIERQGQVRWYQKPRAGSTYVVALDPSLGTGGDPAAIQVIELPSMQQVAEWQHNKTSVQQQVKILQAITQHIYDTVKTETAIYYSVENNTLGEAALVEIAHTGEENIRGIFLSESARVGTGRQFRRGFTTTNRSKIAACSKLKSWIENGKLKIASKNSISELKTFVAHGTSFAAKPGETDDLVMSIILAIRMIQAVQEFDADLDETLRGQEDMILPMPFIMM